MKFVKFLRTLFFTDHLQWLLLKFITLPPLMFSWETCEFFQTAIEHRRASASVFCSSCYSFTKSRSFMNKLWRIKVARVVDIKLFFFMDWFYYDLIMLIKSCKIPYKNLDKALMFSRNQFFCLKNWKFWRAPTTIE